MWVKNLVTHSLLNLHYRDQHVALYNILYISSVRNGLEYWLWWTRLISVWFGMVLQLSAGTNPLTRGRHFSYFLMRFFVSIQVTPTCLSAIMLKNNIFMPRFFSTLPVLHCYLLLSRHCSLKKKWTFEMRGSADLCRDSGATGQYQQDQELRGEGGEGCTVQKSNQNFRDITWNVD